MKKIVFALFVVCVSTSYSKDVPKNLDDSGQVSEFFKSRKIAQAKDESLACDGLATYPAIECFYNLAQTDQAAVKLKVKKLIAKLQKNKNIYDQYNKLEILKSYSKTVNAAVTTHCAFDNYSEEGGSLQRLGTAACVYDQTHAQLGELDKMPLEARPEFK